MGKPNVVSTGDVRAKVDADLAAVIERCDEYAEMAIGLRHAGPDVVRDLLMPPADVDLPRRLAVLRLRIGSLDHALGMVAEALLARGRELPNDPKPAGPPPSPLN